MQANPFDPVIQRYEQTLQKLREFRSLIERDPQIIPALREALLEHSNGHASHEFTVQRPAKASPTGSSLFLRVKAHFDSIGNAWQSSTQIREAVGAERGAISNLLYTARREDFEQRKDPASEKSKQWRLKGGGL